MPVILKTNRTGSQPSYVTGADASGGVSFSEDPSLALVFADATAATNFASGKNVFGAVQVTVNGITNKHAKSIA
jgi:hypothetical protein